MAEKCGPKIVSIMGVLWLCIGGLTGIPGLVTYAIGVLCVCGLWWLDTTNPDDAPTRPRRTRG